MTAKKKATVGSRIEAVRINYNMSQAQLGVMLAKTRAAVSQYEQDKITPRPKVIDRLAEVFGASPEWFTHGRGEPPRAADLSVTIPEINVGLITPALANLRDIKTGREWSLPSSLFNLPIKHNHMMVVFESADRVAPFIHVGERVVVDLERRAPGAEPGVFLAYDASSPRRPGAHLCRYDRCAPKADILGRVVGAFRSL
jgi:transcriptional regulator with XRE-family HTH domain